MMPTYRVTLRETGETHDVDAPFAAEACERLSWLIEKCSVQRVYTPVRTDMLPTRPIIRREHRDDS